MSIKLETVDRHDGTIDIPAAERNFNALSSLIPDFGGKGVAIRFGTAVATWQGGGAASGNVTIPHGLGDRTPVVAGCFSRDTLFEYVVSSRDATNIVVTGFITTNTVVAASSRTFDWFAIG